MSGFKLSPLHPPHLHKVKVRRSYYRTLLGVISLALFAIHYYTPDMEAQAALALNFLFVVDPTV